MNIVPNNVPVVMPSHVSLLAVTTVYQHVASIAK